MPGGYPANALHNPCESLHRNCVNCTPHAEGERRPLPHGFSDPGRQLIGRRDDVREIATRLEAGTHLIVAGARRTGKTSVCEAALARAARRGAYTAKVDLFRVSDAAELAEALASAVIANRSAAHRLLRRARSAGRAALSAAQARAVLKLVGELGEGVELALTPGLAAQDPERALDLALELPERVGRADGRRLILFFDEFQELASARRPYGDPDAVTNRMRAVFQRTDAVATSSPAASST